MSARVTIKKGEQKEGARQQRPDLPRARNTSPKRMDIERVYAIANNSKLPAWLPRIFARSIHLYCSRLVGPELYANAKLQCIT